jgi:glycosyltransferase involved in cell wall biosynthesis
VVHGASNYLNGRAAVLAGALTGARSLYEVRGLWHLTRVVKVPFLEGSDEFRYREEMELATMRDADDVVVISEALGAHLRQRGIADERITVIPNAVDVEHFKPAVRDETLARELGVDGKFVIGFLGSLKAYEGLDVLLDATERLVREGADVALLVVGSGPERAVLRAAARDKGLAEVIRLPGEVPFDSVHRFYSLFDACPFPRTSHAVTRLVPPLKILEAMAMEKPVIVSNLAPLLEMVTPGTTGLCARAGDSESLADQLRALYEDSPHRAALGRAGREWVTRERSWRKISERFLPLYGAS